MSRKIGSCYSTQLQQAIARFLPHRGLPLISGDARVRWSPRMLVVCAVLMAWEGSLTLQDRFEAARATLGRMYPTRRRPGQSYEGFIAALVAWGASLLACVSQELRRAVQSLADKAWQVEGWVVFGCDGSKIDCPRTAANEQAFGRAGRQKSGPQQLLTCLFHVGSGLPWAFVRGAGTDSERSHLLSMLELLPKAALLLADAGFTGYDLLEAIRASGRQFVIRVGSNVRLLTKLGYALEEHEGIVYLWPVGKRKKQLPPLILRLVRLTDSRNRTICLLSSVLDPKQLSDAAALRLYRRRWGVELLYRALKQTLSRRKTLSASPTHAAAELDWSFVGLWLLGLMSVTQLNAAGHEPLQWSPAQALRAVRWAASQRPRRGRGSLARQLAQSLKDQYQRHGSKTARQWPHKKKDKPPGQPKARTATEQEIQLAAEIRNRKTAA